MLHPVSERDCPSGTVQFANFDRLISLRRRAFPGPIGHANRVEEVVSLLRAAVSDVKRDVTVEPPQLRSGAEFATPHLEKGANHGGQALVENDVRPTQLLKCLLIANNASLDCPN